MSTPTPAPAAPALTDPAAAALPGLAALADQLRLLAQEACYAARDGDAQGLAEASERLLPLHVEYARRYRTWLALGRAPAADDSASC